MSFNIGDKVKVVKKFIPNSEFVWLDSMDEDIGKIFEIKAISDCGTRVNFGGWYFPVESIELVESVFDTVTAPTHYTSGAIECIDAIRSALTEEEFRGYCKGNVLKYTWRERMKGGNEDLKKAKQYLEFMEVK